MSICRLERVSHPDSSPGLAVQQQSAAGCYTSHMGLCLHAKVFLHRQCSCALAALMQFSSVWVISSASPRQWLVGRRSIHAPSFLDRLIALSSLKLQYLMLVFYFEICGTRAISALNHSMTASRKACTCCDEKACQNPQTSLLALILKARLLLLSDLLMRIVCSIVRIRPWPVVFTSCQLASPPPRVLTP
jgi:hypothetical protein